VGSRAAIITTTYDPQADILATKFAAPGAAYLESEEVAPGVVLDYDSENRLMGIAVMYVSKRLAGELGAMRTKQAAQ
jgi:uncharacterized protein YuzE